MKTTWSGTRLHGGGQKKNEDHQRDLIAHQLLDLSEQLCTHHWVPCDWKKNVVLKCWMKANNGRRNTDEARGRKKNQVLCIEIVCFTPVINSISIDMFGS